MSSKLSAKFLEMFRNLKSDAVPKPPRRENDEFEETPQAEAHNENVEFTDTPEEVFEDTEKKKKKKPKFKASFFGKNSADDKDKDEERRNSEGSGASSKVNTQATGNVINIVNSKDVHYGDEYIYHVNQYNNAAERHNNNVHDNDEELIQKTNLIILLMEAEIKPEYQYMDYISKNLGKNWYSVFRKLGFTQGRIETVEIDMAKNGISEARYQLILDWVRNDDDGTLGKLATILWEDGERQIVRELAAMYHKSKN